MVGGGGERRKKIGLDPMLPLYKIDGRKTEVFKNNNPTAKILTGLEGRRKRYLSAVYFFKNTS